MERCIAELRSGRPVQIRHGAETWLAQSAETELVNALPEKASLEGRLVLPLERLQALGAQVSGAATIAIEELSIAETHALVFATDLEELPELRPATVAENAALDLLKFAQLLPAVLVQEQAKTEADSWMLDVTVENIRNHHHEVAQALTLVARTPVPLLDDASAEFVVFRGSDGLKDQLAIIVGQPDPTAPVPIRLHSACLTGDLFGSLKCDCGEQLRRAIQSFAESGGGILLYLDQEGRGIGLSNKMRAYALQAGGYDTVDADAVLGYGSDERRYEIAARMVVLLGYKRVSLLTNNPKKIAALNAHGIDVADRIALVGTMNPHNERYLKAKVERSGHLAECATEPAK